MSAASPGRTPALLPARASSSHPLAFTLIEVLVALSIGAVLLAAAASAAQRFGQDVETVRDEDGGDLQQALRIVTDAVRDGWCVALPTEERIEVVDAAGGTTIFERQEEALVVTRPSGAQGLLLSDLADLSVSAETSRRLRDAEPIDVAGAFYSQPDPAGAASQLVLQDGDALALGFTFSSVAPEPAQVLDDVSEQRLAATLDQVALSLSFFNGNLKEFCHLHASPPHNPTHPGYAGGTLRLELYEARAPQDARPIGPLLGALEVPRAALPSTCFYWWDSDDGTVEYPPDSIHGDDDAPACCGKNNHGHPDDGSCDHPGHEKHTHETDVPGGVAWGWWQNHEDVVLVLEDSAEPVILDTTPLSAVLEPGRAYTLVLKVFGWDKLQVPVRAAAGADHSGVALRTGAAGSFVEQPVGLALSLSGAQTCTQTEASDVVCRLTVTLVGSDGLPLTGSAAVTSQTAVSDPWLGPVPGELPALESSP